MASLSPHRERVLWIGVFVLPGIGQHREGAKTQLDRLRMSKQG